MCVAFSERYSVHVSNGICHFYEKDNLDVLTDPPVLKLSIPVTDMLRLFKEVCRQHKEQKEIGMARVAVEWQALNAELTAIIGPQSD